MFPSKMTGPKSVPAAVVTMIALGHPSASTLWANHALAPLYFCNRLGWDDNRLRDVYQAINDARRIVVLCGAGISVHAGIPDFRSPNGLFQSLKREHPRENITSGRDLFDAAIFKSEETMAMFYKMISHLATLSDAAQPTPFHEMLHSLDARGQLLRVYTQNIDALEERAGLSFGVPTFPSRSRKRKAEGSPSPVRPRSSSSERSIASTSHVCTPPGATASSMQSSPASTPTPTHQLPRCVPLHGTLKHLYCPSCYFTLPLCAPNQLEALKSGNSLACPQCAELDGTRRLVGKRTRGVARLRPGVVLYNEPHREGEAERVGECVRRDLIGLGSGQLSRTSSARKKRSGEDLLIVAGTSLRIPGAKRIVREFSKALHPILSTNLDDDVQTHQTAVKTVYLNFDFPVPAREWDGVFDVWVQGDIQMFARGFENYQVEAERGSTNVTGSIITPQPKRSNLDGIREPRTPARGVTHPTKSLEESVSQSRPTSVVRKPKHTFTPKLPGSPRLRARALHPTYVDHQSLQHTSSQIKHAPESSTCLKIRIKRPVGMHTPEESKLQLLPLPQEIHNPLVPVDVDQGPG
ncbi:Sir2 family [Rhizoctonia solani]|uniref:Sir2 family n=1 Tax=Rhizoctonia solani TaxID=456999 RepID=A0A8H7H0Y7_9AGAM|nr:Sir2 family [Rhizoctonia solani]